MEQESNKFSTGILFDVDIDLEKDTINVQELPMEHIICNNPMPSSPWKLLRSLLSKHLRALSPVGVQDKFGLTGQVSFTLTDTLTGKVKQKIEIHNLVVTTGKVWLAQRLNDETVNNQSHVAIGTSSQAPAVGDTGLIGTQIVRVAATKSRTSNATKWAAQYVAGVGTSASINEAGIFDGASGTVMMARVITPSTINKSASDELNIEWTITAN